MHFVSAAVGFFSLIAACFVFARAFAGSGERGWAAYSAVTGVIFLASFAGLASGGGNEALNLAFGAAVAIAWAWLSALAIRLGGELSR
jgi:hypothetical protein